MAVEVHTYWGKGGVQESVSVREEKRKKTKIKRPEGK